MQPIGSIDSPHAFTSCALAQISFAHHLRPHSRRPPIKTARHYSPPHSNPISLSSSQDQLTMAPSPRYSPIRIIVIFMIFISLHPIPHEAARPLPSANTNAPAPATNRAELFVRSACGSTTYPNLCISSLSSYSSSINSSPALLAHAALTVSLDGARSASTAMRSLSSAAGARMRPREAGAMSDCMENVRDSIEELSNSLSEMRSLRAGKEMGYKISSVQTWVSAALTDDESCMDGFGAESMDGSVRTAVRGHVVNVAHLTSNALALINALASTTGQSVAHAP